MFMYSISTKLHAHASCYCDAFMIYAHHRRVFSLLLCLCRSRDQQVLNGEWGVYLPSSQRCLYQPRSWCCCCPCAVWYLTATQRWRCHFNFILSAKMTLQRGSRKRKSQSEENDLGCAKILTEFQILQSLIPQIAGRIDITEVGSDIFFFNFTKLIFVFFLAWNHRCMCGLHWILAKPVKPKWNISLQVASEELIDAIYHHQIVYPCQMWNWYTAET